jgi:CRP-like cAMP-binding protein
MATNQLLGMLSETSRERLLPHLERVSLRRNAVLFRSREPLAAVYFPQTSVVSLVSALQSGQAVEVGLVGRDGLAGMTIVGSPPAMTCDGIVRVAGDALRIGASVLRREMLADHALQAAVASFGEVMFARSMQLSVCNAFHSVEQRAARWLLSVADLIGHAEIPSTHDAMAAVLGVRRPTVTLALRALAGTGSLVETRGRIVLRDRVLLEDACCECYETMRLERRRLLGY